MHPTAHPPRIQSGACCWQHRCAHTCSWLWPFHAGPETVAPFSAITLSLFIDQNTHTHTRTVHHAVQRLYALNTGRFHFLDQFLATLVSFPVLHACGFGASALRWYAGLRTVVGVLSHSNIDTDCGWLNYIFNTPEVRNRSDVRMACILISAVTLLACEGTPVAPRAKSCLLKRKLWRKPGAHGPPSRHILFRPGSDASKTGTSNCSFRATNSRRRNQGAWVREEREQCNKVAGREQHE